MSTLQNVAAIVEEMNVGGRNEGDFGWGAVDSVWDRSGTSAALGISHRTQNRLCQRISRRINLNRRLSDVADLSACIAGRQINGYLKTGTPIAYRDCASVELADFFGDTQSEPMARHSVIQTGTWLERLSNIVIVRETRSVIGNPDGHSLLVLLGSNFHVTCAPLKGVIKDIADDLIDILGITTDSKPRIHFAYHGYGLIGVYSLKGQNEIIDMRLE